MEILDRLGRMFGLDPARGTRRGRQVQVEPGVSGDHLVCLESGERVVLLGSHLARRFGMTPEEYRRRWGLSDNYPMVAPGYAARRQAVRDRHGAPR